MTWPTVPHIEGNLYPKEGIMPALHPYDEAVSDAATEALARSAGHGNVALFKLMGAIEDAVYAVADAARAAERTYRQARIAATIRSLMGLTDCGHMRVGRACPYCD